MPTCWDEEDIQKDDEVSHAELLTFMLSHLEASRAPVDELNGTSGLYICDGGVHILGDDVASVQQAARHVLAVARVTLDHLIGRLEAGTRDLGHSQLLVVRLDR